MVNLSAQIADLPMGGIIALVVVFGILAIASGIWWWIDFRKTRNNLKQKDFIINQKSTLRLAFNKNKFLIVFAIFVICFLGTILILLSKLTNFVLF